MEIEKRRSKRRQRVKSKYQHMFIDTPQHTDLSFWMTQKGDDAKMSVPEESKGIRVKMNKHFQYEMNYFRWHALQNFIYWLRKDDTLKLSPGLKPAHTGPSHLSSCQCNQCTGRRHPYL
ncbi:hypothetical protein ACOMHN_011660 [Nucella lapillus]